MLLFSTVHYAHDCSYFNYAAVSVVAMYATVLSSKFILLFLTPNYFS